MKSLSLQDSALVLHLPERVARKTAVVDLSILVFLRLCA